MKKILGLILVMGLFTITYGQDGSRPQIRTLFGNDGHTSHGGYGALTFSYGQIDGKDAFMAGFKGGWLIDHHFTFGLAGNGFINNMEFQHINAGNSINLVGGYGGFLFEPILWPFSSVHLAFPVVVGAGGLAYLEFDDTWAYQNQDPVVWDEEAFFIFEPGVEIEMNVAKFMRIALGGSYKLTSKLNLLKTEPDALQGFSANLSLKFGKF